MTIRLIIGSDHVLLYLRVRILDSSRYHHSVDATLLDEVDSLRICISSVYEAVGDLVMEFKIKQELHDVVHK